MPTATDLLLPVVKEAFGVDREFVDVKRMKGGSKKGAYRLELDDRHTVLAYVWSDDEDYWPGEGVSSVDEADPFSHPTGLRLFDAAHRQLSAVGVRVPDVYAIERSGPADIALVEYVNGPKLEELAEQDDGRARTVIERLGDALDLMFDTHASTFGKVSWVEDSGMPYGKSCEDVVVARALDDLAEAAGRDQRVATARIELEAVLQNLAGEVQPRAEYRLIHGELGPDHVLVDEDDRPVLIDIEGLMYFDVEWEHVFLKIRFDEAYHQLDRPDLDPRRMDLYDLAMRLSLVAGPLRLLDGDFPDRDFMRGVIEHNLRHALGYVTSAH